MEATEFLRARIETAAHTAIHGTQVGPITVSAGVSTRVLGARSLQELLEQSDEALYVSKRTGRNRVTAFTRIAAQDEAAQEEAVAS